MVNISGPAASLLVYPMIVEVSVHPMACSEGLADCRVLLQTSVWFGSDTGTDGSKVLPALFR